MDLVLAPEAEADLDSAWLYVAQESGSTETANRFTDALLERIWVLSQFPQIGRRRDRDLREGLRSFVFGEYVVLYRFDGEVVFVLRILHGSRDISSLLR
jgi:toxin ParE1/3/4